MTKQQEAHFSSSTVKSRLKDSVLKTALAMTLAVPFAIAFALMAFVLNGPDAFAESSRPASSLQIETFKTHSRLAISLDPSVEAEWKEVAGGFQLLLKGVALQDLYLGSVDLDSLRDSRVDQIQATEVDGGIRIDGKWKFAAGENAVANPEMERFTYREKSPARFVVDFWAKGGSTVRQVKQNQSDKARKSSIDRAEAEAKSRRDRRIAAEKAMLIESDVARFCKEPLREGLDIFLEFVPDHEAPNLAEYLPTGQPNEGYPFLDPKPGQADTKYVKLALELFAKRDYALVIRTVDFLEKEVPSSLHRVDMRFLRANALNRLGMKTEANAAFETVREEHPGSPAALASALFLADQMRLADNGLQTVERYLWIATQYPKHRNVWVWRMFAAEALYRLKQTDRAVKEYEWVAENGPDRASRAMASLRIGDAYLHRGQFDRALAAYFDANQKFPEEFLKLPSAQVNRGEALYWLGQFDRAETQFQEFTDRFPGHPSGWRALLRIAEITGRRPGDDSNQKSRAAFLATINHYPFSPGAVIARMRLVPCEDHGGFDAKSAGDFFKKETAQFTGDGIIRMDRFGEFRSMIRVRSMINLNDPVAALDAAIQEKDEVSRKSGAYEWLQGMQRKLFRKQVLALMDAGKKFEAVKFFDLYAGKVNLSEELPENASADRLALSDPEYLLRLSRVASELGLGRTATKIAKRYDTETKAYAAARSIASGGADLDARLKVSERSFTDAKAEWTASETAGKQKNLDSIRAKLAKVTDESPFAYQKEIILGLIAEQAKSFATALSHASKASMLLVKITKEDSIERVAIDQWIASLQAEGGNARGAIESYRKLQRSNPAASARARAEGVGLKPVGTKVSWIIAEGELSAKVGRWGDAADAYGRAVNSGVGGNRAMYQYALALEKSGGDSTEISNILKKVSDSKSDDFWKELARKKIAGTTAMEGNSL